MFREYFKYSSDGYLPTLGISIASTIITKILILKFRYELLVFYNPILSINFASSISFSVTPADVCVFNVIETLLYTLVQSG